MMRQLKKLDGWIQCWMLTLGVCKGRRISKKWRQ